MFDMISELFWFVVVAAVVGVIYVGMQYNQIQQLWQAVLASRSNVDASLKKRKVLVKKLEDIALDFAQHEHNTQVAIAQEASGSIRGTVGFIDRIAGQFPDLKTNGPYQQLMNQLHGVENDLQSKFEAYAYSAQQFNTRICQFPTNLYAGKLGFKPAPFVSAEDEDALDSREFTSNDGQVVREMLAGGAKQMVTGARQMVDGTKQLGDKLVTKGRELSMSHLTAADSEPMSTEHSSSSNPEEE